MPRTRTAPHAATVLPPAVPIELAEAIAGGKCAVFVGAGLSAAAGYPNWVSLLLKLASVCRERKVIRAAKEKELIRLVKNPDKLLMVAEELRECLGKEEFEAQLVTAFSEDKPLTNTHRQIMKVPFSLAITTNYDLCLDRAYLAERHDLPRGYTNAQPAEIAAALAREDFFILKAHGDVNNRASLVITERDYRSIIYHSHGYRSALGAVFTMKTVLFIGVSFADPELRLLLAYLHDAFHGGRRHFALVPEREFSATVVNRWSKDFRVECLTYKATPGHPEVEAFVNLLPLVRSSPVVAPPAPTTKTGRRSRVRKKGKPRTRP
jgi:hypothetical protein